MRSTGFKSKKSKISKPTIKTNRSKTTKAKIINNRPKILKNFKRKAKSKKVVKGKRK
jgi:hypothetical protein